MDQEMISFYLIAFMLRFRVASPAFSSDLRTVLLMKLLYLLSLIVIYKACTLLSLSVHSLIEL